MESALRSQQLTQRAVLLAAILIAILGVLSRKPAIAGSTQEPTSEMSRPAAVGRLLCDLAAERYAQNTANGQTWVLTAEVGKHIRKFSDGKTTVLILPIPRPEDREAVVMYLTPYNALTLQAADDLAKAKRYARAEEIYSRLARFNCSGPVFENEIRLRRQYLKQIQRGDHVVEAEKALVDLYKDYTSYTDIPEIATAPTTVVTNLLEVPFFAPRIPQ